MTMTSGMPWQSLIDPAMNWSSYVTTIDIAGELFGLSTLFLGVDFYRDSAGDFCCPVYNCVYLCTMLAGAWSLFAYLIL